MLRALKSKTYKFLYTIIKSALKEVIIEDTHNIKNALQRDALEDSVEWLINEKVNLSTAHEDRMSLLKTAISRCSVKGLILEFGVYKGSTINFISEQIPNKFIYGFDSFEGLKEPWIYRESGAFSDIKGAMPKVLENVLLIKGDFQDTLPEFINDNGENIAFLHIDSDLYSSAKYVLEKLQDRIIPGTVIVFDEFFNYPNWKEGEYKAWNEFVEKFDVNYEIIGFTYQRTKKHKSGNQVAFKIIEKNGES